MTVNTVLVGTWWVTVISSPLLPAIIIIISDIIVIVIIISSVININIADVISIFTGTSCRDINYTHFPTGFNQFRKFPQRVDICF